MGIEKAFEGLKATSVLDAGGSEQRTYGQGRRCSHAGCLTILSVYNPEELCFTHMGPPSDEPDPARSARAKAVHAGTYDAAKFLDHGCYQLARVLKCPCSLCQAERDRGKRKLVPNPKHRRT